MTLFAMHGYAGTAEDMGFGRLQAAFTRRGLAATVFRSPETRSKTPNRDRTAFMVEALRDVTDDVVLLGLSNQGLFLPLIAAARPVRRIVMINAAVPTPGKSFLEAFEPRQVFTNWFVRRYAQSAPFMSEVCPLERLPDVEYVYVSGDRDGSIRPAWQQATARDYLHVEPVVVRGARHGSIVTTYADTVVDAAVHGLDLA